MKQFPRLRTPGNEEQWSLIEGTQEEPFPCPAFYLDSSPGPQQWSSGVQQCPEAKVPPSQAEHCRAQSSTEGHRLQPGPDQHPGVRQTSQLGTGNT